MFSSLSISSILSIVQGLLSLGSKIADYMEQKQLMDAGTARAQKQALEETRDAVQKAIAARRRANDDLRDGGVPDDYKHFR